MKGGEDMEKETSEVLPVENMNTDVGAEATAVQESTEPLAEKKSRSSRVKGEASSRKRKATAVTLDVDASEDKTPEFSTVEIDESEAERLENEAIAALPHAESLDSLMYDSYDYEDSHESVEERESYESFFAEYKRVISEALTYSSEKDGETSDTEREPEDESRSEDEGEPTERAPENTDEGEDAPADTEETDTEGEGEPTAPGAEQLEMELVVPEQEKPLSPEDAEIPPEDEEEPEYAPEKPRKIDSLFDFVELFVFTLLAVMLLTSFFFRNSIVDGDSMNGTLIDGEHLIITDVFYTPERGDIIVFEDFTIDTTDPLVKRVIAVGGDMIRVTGGKVYVNEELVTEAYVSSLEVRKEVPLMTVPEGEVFVMGDNRANSHDSRDFGTVSEDSILGKVVLRFYPFDKFGKVE